ncbi:serotriflin [Tupaia chinensis]|uniref:serotriflin n=1 Tax=Tupaia chinensis TaxID=246437 RepID=UPI0003C8EE0A|nr:serotriflin [Tupaia chinensis]XP_027627907.1 serotriflin [Tupaia chinensis]XP_027627908.1 serotriflin [Tupaia chinensis]XP_027627909.1 serotriflin [Tupaia chinensis]
MMLVSICLMVLLQQTASTGDVSYFSLMTHDRSVQMDITNKHNQLRRLTQPSASNMLKLTWNDQVAQNAEKWAKKCTMSHSPPHERQIRFADCGENLFMSSNPRNWSYAIQSLYNEVTDFRYGSGDTRPNVKTGHYTQLVWATSHQLGCALAHCPNKRLKFYYVCQYCPAGNNIKTRNTPYKKGKPCADCPGHCDNGLCTNPCMYQDRFSNCQQLTQNYKCGSRFMEDNCPATCKCLTEIK